MNILDLKELSVSEVQSNELNEINGGLVKEALTIASDLADNWRAYKAAFLKGIVDGGGSIF